MNFGTDALPEHDLRYDMADEYIEACRGLWGGWDTDAVIADKERGILVDLARCAHSNLTASTTGHADR